MNRLPFHPHAELFPLMTDAERAEMRDDIRDNGLREPIDLLGGSVLDGRNRYLCCVDLVESGELRGKGWGIYADAPLTLDEITPGESRLFRLYSEIEHGDPLDY